MERICEIVYSVYFFFFTNMAQNQEDIPQAGLALIQMQALVSHLERLFDRKIERLHERLEQMEN